MSKSELDGLLKKYHQGFATAEEEQRLFELLKDKPDAEELENSMLDIWEQAPSTSPLGFDKDELFNGIAAQIDENNKNQFSIGKFYKSIFWVAASLTIVLASTFFVVRHFEEPAQVADVSQLREFSTGKGQFRTVSLPDGTVVKLNTSSSLKIGQTYSSDAERVVHLQGEAFFDVHRNEQRPFRVITKDIEVQVLGTSFNVNSNFNNKAIKVAVASGKVKVERKDKSNQVYLEKNQMVTIAENQFLKLTGYDPMKEMGWVTKHLVFDQADFDQVVVQLENWFGVDIKVAGSEQAVGQWNYTAVFENQSLDNVLLSMGFVKKFEYEINDKEVKLKF